MKNYVKIVGASEFSRKNGKTIFLTVASTSDRFCRHRRQRCRWHFDICELKLVTYFDCWWSTTVTNTFCLQHPSPKSIKALSPCSQKQSWQKNAKKRCNCLVKMSKNYNFVSVKIGRSNFGTSAAEYNRSSEGKWSQRCRNIGTQRKNLRKSSNFLQLIFRLRILQLLKYIFLLGPGPWISFLSIF